MRTAEAVRLSKAWGERVRARRRAMHATQEEIARRLGRDQSWVSRYERGEASFSIEVMLAFARALDEPPEALFPWSVEDHSRSASSRNSSGTTLCVPSATEA